MTEIDRDFVAQEIESLRDRLVDMSKRNRLLNFQHTERGATFVRVVDESPDFLVRRLRTRKMTFEPLPDPETIPADEKTESFQSALEAARLTDDEYKKAIQGLGDSPEDAEKLNAANTRLRHSVRAAEGLPAILDGQKLNIIEFAKAHGFNPDFELTNKSAAADFEDNDAVHLSDDKIRVLLTESQLARKLAAVKDRAKSIEDETGIRTLNAAFGFVEWRESDSAEARFLAPLLLLPVTLELKLLGGLRRYALFAGDEDLTANAALAEFLRRKYGCELPALGENEAPESYFTRVGDLFAKLPLLALRRYVTIAILPYPNMSLWRDLGVAGWPEPGIADHRGVATLLGGLATNVGPLGTFPTDYPLDETKWTESAPRLIMPADVSQHSAIVDAAEGKDLVIEGPPGTGKSQTIANLVAAAAHAGKRVLFLAEKKAALGAVADRLAKCGLAPLLLELHSEKTTKSSVLESLRDALKRYQERPAPRPRANSEYAGKQKVLAAYGESLLRQTRFADDTIYNLIWQEMHLREDLGRSVSRRIVAVLGEGLLAATAQDNEERIGALKELSAAAAKIEVSLGGLRSSPWHRAGRLSAQPFAQDRLLSKLSELQSALHDLQTQLNGIFREIPAPLSTASLAKLLVDLDAFAKPTCDNRILAAAISGELDQDIRAQAEKLAGLRSRLRCLVNSDLRADTSAVEEIEADLRKLGKMGCSPASLKRELHEADATLEALRDIYRVALKVFRKLGTGEPLTSSLARLILRIIEIAKRYPPAVIEMCPAAADADAASRAEQFGKVVQDLVRALEGLSALIDLESARQAGPRELRDIAGRLANSDFVSRLFRRAYAEARASASALLRHKHAARKQADLLSKTAQLLEAEASILASPTGQELFGKSWNGTATPFAEFKRAREAMAAIQQNCRAAGRTDLVVPFANLLPGMVELQSLPEVGTTAAIDRLSADLPLEGLIAKLADRTANLHEAVRKAAAVGIAESAQILGDGEPLSRKLSGILLEIGRVGDRLDDDRRAALELATGDLAGAQAAIEYAHRLAGNKTLTGGKTASDAAIVMERLVAQAEALHEATRSIASRSADIAGELGAADFDGLSADQSLAERIAALAGAVSDEIGLKAHADLHRYLARASELGVRVVYDIQLEDNLPINRLHDVYRLAWLQAALSRHLEIDDPELTRMGGDRLEAARCAFREHDGDLRQHHAADILAKWRKSRIEYGNNSGPVSTHTGLALIEHELGKRKRNLPIRDLVGRAGAAIQALKPVLMSSPHALATYCPPGKLEFDLIVIDEASQMKPEFAIGAIARSRQFVIVGDRQQLPPTEFFHAVGEEAGEDFGVAQDSESILDLAYKRIPNRRRLRWHYRSRHPSLIGFSNREFYDNELVVFPPAAAEVESLGVRSIKVDGVYHTGLNEIEADRTVAEAVSYIYRAATDPSADFSIGIATMNRDQRELIFEKLQRRAAGDEILRRYIERWEETFEPLFVKNLENVQGDERDIVIISTVYGPSEPGGKVAQRFGPVNSPSGHRRLNVLFSRAKRATIVVTSLSPADIVPGPNSSRGVHVLRAWLDYAAGGPRHEDEHRDEPESAFEHFVGERLEASGYNIAFQVGAEKFRIDIAVRDPDDTTIFLAGIECDGAQYHSGMTARDRDAIRQEILEKLGWKIYRVWSTDWFNDSERELKKLLDWLDARRQEARVRRIATPRESEPAPVPESAPLLPDREAGKPAQAAEPAGKTAPETRPAPAAPAPAAQTPPTPVGEGKRPRGRHIRRKALDVYEVDTGLFEVWKDGELMGEVEREAGEPPVARLVKGVLHSPMPRFTGRFAGSDITFRCTDIYEAFDRVGSSDLTGRAGEGKTTVEA
jgi:very-short-patch-repair endonuclease